MRKLSREDRELVSTTRASGVGGTGGEHWVELCMRYEALLAEIEEKMLGAQEIRCSEIEELLP